MPNDSASRYGPAEDPGYEGFHTYATSDLYDSNGGDERWPDNWAAPQSAVPYPGESHADDEDEYDDEDEAAIKRDYWTALLWTSGWYAVPIIILVLRALLLSGDPDPVCTAAGLGGCTSPRADALATLISNAPLWCFSLVGALTLALVLRWASDSWRAATIGFCAAVVSGGAMTVLYGIL
ncbi:MAG TPA: hypothetical protein DGG94_15045 [Micromonosporaceae bacterium]|nr:hypothetical protein [Micromonosporaceae bacterium]HCU51087.1 hypothetical protein [Micromonosporaceae bacterium]